MNTIEAMRLFCDGRMSAHDVRALLVSMGHSERDIAEAFVRLSETGGIRIGAYQRGEYQAELYLTV